MSGKSVFLSYRRDAAGKLFARLIEQALTQRGYAVFLDVDSIESGHWKEQLYDQVPARDHFLLLLTPNALTRCAEEQDWVRREYELAVQHRRNIVPVRNEDFNTSSERESSPDSVRGVFDLEMHRVAHSSFVADIDELVSRFIPPHRAPTSSSAVSGPGDPATAPRAITFVPSWTNELQIYGTGFAGRQEELAALDAAWSEGQTRVFTLHAEGGAGKTRVLVKWLNDLRDDHWRGGGGVFVHSFYSQGSDERRNASSELFFQDALAYFGYRGEPITDSQAKGRKLAELIVGRCGLLVLDGLEPLQHPTAFNDGRLKDPAIERLLLSLSVATAGSAAPALCVVTSRQPVVELQAREGRAVVQRHLERLDATTGSELLRQLEVRGPDRELREAVEDFNGHAYSLMLLGSYLRDATDDREIRRRHEIPLLEEDQEHRFHARHMFSAYVQHLGANKPEVAVLRLLGFFDRAAEHALLDVLRESREDGLQAITAPLRDLSPTAWQRVLRRLKELRLIVFEPGTSSIDSHPLLREYFSEWLRTNDATAWTDGHRCLYEHLCETTAHRPDTLDGLQPLYQAITHGCQAGMQQEACDKVYHDRILRGTGVDGFYSSKQLGAIGADLGAVACFFDHPWSTPSPNLAPANQAWLLNDAGYCLRALGRLTESVQPMQAGLAMHIEHRNWEYSAINASNLSELELTLGAMSDAVAYAEQSVTFADRSEEEFQRYSKRTTLANALHQSSGGSRIESKSSTDNAIRDESRRLFVEAETMQASRQPAYPRLYSLRGFRYCDLLLSDAERLAWHVTIVHLHQRVPREEAPPSNASSRDRLVSANSRPNEQAPVAARQGDLDACSQVAERANQWFEWRTPTDSLQKIGLEHLTAARAALYAPLLSTESFGDGRAARAHADKAVNGLSKSGNMIYLPLGLLTRAWFRRLTNDTSGAKEDLDEAWEIAERGPMPLYQADILLSRVRLFGSSRETAEYPWDSARDDLAKARELIDKHGYRRRIGELEDTETAMNRQ